MSANQQEAPTQEVLDDTTKPENTIGVPLAPNGNEESPPDLGPSSTDEHKCDEVRLAEIRQKFAGKAMSYFDMAKQALEYFELKKRNIAQSAQKGRVGRPGIISEMARELEIPGKSDKAKRAWLDRALKVANLSPEAKDAAVKAKLEKNRSALIEIAKAGDRVEQIKRVEEIEKRKAKAEKEAKMFVKKKIRFPAVGGDEILAKLIKFAEHNRIEFI